MAKASDNVFPLLRLAPGAAPASPASGSVALFIDSTDGTLKTKDAAGVVKGIGGSGGGTRDLRWFTPSGTTSIDEFNDDTLDPAWVRVDGSGAAAANATWTERGDSLSLYQGGGDAASVFRGLVRPLSGFGGSVAVGDAFVTSMRLHGGQANFLLGGIILTDGVTFGSGNQVAASAHLMGANGGTTINARAASGWTFASANSDMTLSTNQLFLRLVCTSANTWRADTSPDGITWLQGGPAISKVITPTHVGLCSSSFGTSTLGVISYDFVRRVSGVS